MRKRGRAWPNRWVVELAHPTDWTRTGWWPSRGRGRIDRGEVFSSLLDPEGDSWKIVEEIF